MPELPEVETVRRTIAAALVGKRIAAVDFPPDEIVCKGFSPELLMKSVQGARVEAVGRKGKYFWLEFDRRPWLFAHLGMAGWVREVGEHSIRLREHGNAPFEDAAGNARFLKMRLEAEDGRQIVMTDGRRLARIWLAESPKASKNIAALGPDVFADPWQADELHVVLRKRKAPIKAMLLDQSLFAGVGNWIADEVLYQAKIRPDREASTLTLKEVDALLKALAQIVELAVDAGADSAKYPPSWLFHHRWGGAKGVDAIEGQPIVREQIGGRTTAWVPSRQR